MLTRHTVLATLGHPFISLVVPGIHVPALLQCHSLPESAPHDDIIQKAHPLVAYPFMSDSNIQPSCSCLLSGALRASPGMQTAFYTQAHSLGVHLPGERNAPKAVAAIDCTGCAEPPAQQEVHGAAHRQACYRHANWQQAVSRGVLRSITSQGKIMRLKQRPLMGHTGSSEHRSSRRSVQASPQKCTAPHRSQTKMLALSCLHGSPAPCIPSPVYWLRGCEESLPNPLSRPSLDKEQQQSGLQGSCLYASPSPCTANPVQCPHCPKEELLAGQ